MAEFMKTIENKKKTQKNVPMFNGHSNESYKLCFYHTKEGTKH